MSDAEKRTFSETTLWLAPLGIFLIFAGAFFQENYISTVVHVFTDIIAVVLIIIGLLNTVRFFI